jgi:hypothetical protein
MAVQFSTQKALVDRQRDLATIPRICPAASG